jgi:double-stranded uracil-DNA glycosylase
MKPNRKLARPGTQAEAWSRGFPPVAGGGAKILILGSLPGRASIAAGQYYAQPQNAFWRIMGALVGAGPELDYAERLVRLRASSIALWDVLAAGSRQGSLDSAIVPATAVVNDFGALFERERAIEAVFFNGRTAEHLYRRRVLPRLPAPLARIPCYLLPSTSPAYASLRPEAKLERWSVVLKYLRPRGC